MCDFCSPPQVDIALAGACEVNVLPTRLQINETNPRLLTIDFRTAFTDVDLSLVMEMWARIFPEATLFSWPCTPKLRSPLLRGQLGCATLAESSGRSSRLATATSLLHSLKRPERLTLLSLPYGDALLVNQDFNDSSPRRNPNRRNWGRWRSPILTLRPFFSSSALDQYSPTGCAHYACNGAVL